MVFGVNDAFPLAMFLHANAPTDIELDHLEGKATILLVDSVVNEGNTVIKFAKHVRELHASIRIVIVAGVVQSEFVSQGSNIHELALAEHGKVGLIALRLSDNKFKGKESVDTGNRLFNTTHFD